MNRDKEKTGLKEEIKAAAWELFMKKDMKRLL